MVLGVVDIQSHFDICQPLGLFSRLARRHGNFPASVYSAVFVVSWLLLWFAVVADRADADEGDYAGDLSIRSIDH